MGRLVTADNLGDNTLDETYSYALNGNEEFARWLEETSVAEPDDGKEGEKTVTLLDGTAKPNDKLEPRRIRGWVETRNPPVAGDRCFTILP